MTPVIAALLLAACGGSSSAASKQESAAGEPESAAATIARAADVSSAEAGYRMSIAMTEALGSSGTLTATGAGSFSASPRAGSMSLDMTIPGAGAALGALNMQMVFKGDTFFMKLPSTLTSLIPGGKQWLMFTLSQIGSAGHIPGFGALVKSEGSLSDPGQYLSYLRATSRRGIQDLGPATINGVKTTRYRAQLDLAKLASTVPAADRSAAGQLANELEQNEHVSETPIDAWIDASHRVRRIELSYSLRIPVKTGGAPEHVSLALTENFTSYGPQPVPAAPAADQTTDLSSLLSGLSLS